MSITPSEEKAFRRGNKYVKNERGMVLSGKVTQIESLFVFKTIKLTWQINSVWKALCKPYFYFVWLYLNYYKYITITIEYENILLQNLSGKKSQSNFWGEGYKIWKPLKHTVLTLMNTWKCAPAATINNR